MSKAKLFAAKELIEEKQYDAARAVLETVPADLKAQEWLRKLPKKRRSSGLARIIIGALLLIIGFGLGNATANRNAPRSQGVAQATEAPSTATRISATSTITPTVNNVAGTQAARDGEATRSALNAVAQATNLALTLPPTAIPPTPAPVVFEGTTDQVLGPITFTSGLFQARVITAGYFIASLQITEGECGTGSFILSPSIFILSSGDALPEAETTIRSEGCTAYIATSNITDSWRLEIVPLS